MWAGKVGTGDGEKPPERMGRWVAWVRGADRHVWSARLKSLAMTCCDAVARCDYDVDGNYPYDRVLEWLEAAEREREREEGR